MDAWVLTRSWAHPNTIGYEIKVDRSDFINDNKWHEYLPYCNSFYFVCPKDVIKESEVPGDAGLYYCTLPSHRLLLKKKAPWRDVNIPITLFTYVLMCRTKIIGDTSDARSKLEYWESWLKEKERTFEVGRQVGKRLRELIDRKITEVDRQNSDLQYQIDKYEQVVEVIKELGLETGTSSWRLVDQIKEKIKELSQGCPEGLLASLNRAITELEVARNLLSRGRGK
jgi:hypothetical protein